MALRHVRASQFSISLSQGAGNRRPHRCSAGLLAGSSGSSSFVLPGARGLLHTPSLSITAQACTRPQSLLSPPSASRPGSTFTRSYSTAQGQLAEEVIKSKRKASELSADQYHALSDDTMDNLLVFMEELVETEGNAENGWDVEYDSGVMTIHFGSKHGTYVLNKQPPNKQVWLSSPISGPKRYDYDGDAQNWFYSRDGQSLGSLLSQEFSHILGREVSVPID